MDSLRIIFAGTPDFSIPTLKELLDSEHEVLAVLTQPDRPKGRGKKITESPIKKIAIDHNIPVYQPASLKDDSIQNIIRDYRPDLIIVVAYGLLIPQAVLDIPKGGCINIHGSLLPKYRGAAPIQYSILNGEAKTGITIMQMEAGLDTGPMLLKKEIDINITDTTKSLSKKLSLEGSKLLLKTLKLYQNGKLQPVIQDDSLATYAPKIEKDMARLNFNETAEKLCLKVRALYPNPIAHTKLNGERIKILEAQVVDGTGHPGEIIAFTKEGLDVATSNSILRITKCQLPGKKPLEVAFLINGYKEYFKVGNKLM